MMTSPTRRSFLTMASIAATAAMLGPRLRTALADSGEIDEIRWALPSVPETLFIPHGWSTDLGAIMSLVQEGPLSFGDDLSLVPAAADRWEQADPTTYRYHLRQGATFGDGSALTPDDVVATMKFHLDPNSGSRLAAFYNSVASVEASGPAEAIVKLKSPNVLFRYTAATMAGFIFKKSQLEEHPTDIGTPEVLVLGTGPYRLTEFAPGDRVVLEANAAYWGPKAVAKRITFRAISDRQARLRAMQNDEIDGSFDISLSDVDQWKALKNVDIITAPSLGIYCLTLDHSAPPFDDVRVRRAIAFAVDRVGLVTGLLQGYGEPAVALDPPEIWARIEPVEAARAFYDTLPSYGFDLDKAKAELAQSTLPNGFAVSVPGPTGDPYMLDILRSLSANLRQLGIDLKVQAVDDEQWRAGYFRHEQLGMQIMRNDPDFPDPANDPFLFFDSANAVKGGMNGSNFKNPDVDRYLAAAMEQTDPKARAEALQQVFRIVGDDVAVVPIFWPLSAMAINSKYKLTGYTAFWYAIPWAIRGFGLK
jgi:peptide/nickel transport system substrate-binding protein